MKNRVSTLIAASVILNMTAAFAQFGAGGMSGPRGPEMGGAMTKVFGDNAAFTATVEMQSEANPSGKAMTGKMACDNGKSRFEIDLVGGGAASEETAAQMKAMGMDRMVMISRPDKKISYMVYPGLQAYSETAIQSAEAVKSASDFKVETKELGKETVDGHSCVKNKVVTTDDKGNKTEFTTWNATDLKNFPVKIQQGASAGAGASEGTPAKEGSSVTMLFKDIKIEKPDAAQFEPPTDYKKYATMMEMMQQEMMKRMGGGMGMPGGR
jgi:hypothetical protein